MLTEKETRFLNFLYKKLGKHLPTLELAKFIEEKIRLGKEKSYELAYLYDHNFEQANGDFSNVTEPKRESYVDYMDSIPTNIKIMMEFLNEKDPTSFSEAVFGIVTYLGDGTEYMIYDSINELMDIAIEGADWICDDPEEWAESYVYMSEDQRSSFADEQADSYFDDLGDDEIIDRGNIGDDLKTLEDQKNDPENTKTEEEIEEEKQEMIDEVRERLKEEYRDEIYYELDKPVEYFVGNGFYNSVRQLVRSGPVEFDCDSAKNDYFDNADYETIVNSAGYDRYDSIIFERREYYIVWN